MEQEIRKKYGNKLKSFSSYSVTLSGYDKTHDNGLQSIVTSHGYTILNEIGGTNKEEDYTVIFSYTL